MKFTPTLPVLGLLLGLLASEAFLRLGGTGYGNAPFVSDPILHHVHPKDYVFVMHHPSGEMGGHRIRYDESGLLVDPDAPASPLTPKSTYRMALMGDSFSEGLQVPFRRTFFSLLARRSRGNVEIKNFSCSSYSPVLYNLQWMVQVHKWRPTHLLLLLNYTDVLDDKMYFSKGRFDQRKELLAVPGPGNDAWRVLLRKSYLVRFLRKLQLQLAWRLKQTRRMPLQVVGGYVEDNPEISDLTAQFVLKLNQEVKASGAEFVLMVVPSKYRLEPSSWERNDPEFSDRWKTWAQEQSIPFIDLVEPFRRASRGGQELYFKRDIHWNDQGHRLVAETLTEAFPNLFQRD